MSIEHNILNYIDILKLTEIIRKTDNSSKGQELLNKIVYINAFVREMDNCLNSSDNSIGYTSCNDEIICDYNTLSDFVNDLCEVLNRRL